MKEDRTWTSTRELREPFVSPSALKEVTRSFLHFMSTPFAAKKKDELGDIAGRIEKKGAAPVDGFSGYRLQIPLLL